MQSGQSKSYAIEGEKKVSKALEESNLTLGQKDSAKLIKIISNKAGRLQTGFIYDYAFVMLIGLSILLTYLILN